MTRAGVLMMVLAAAACAPPDRLPRREPVGDTLRFSTKDLLRTLDPVSANDDLSMWVLHPMLDTLVTYDPATMELVPQLAESWEVSADGRTYTFALREARYDDGSPIRADDFVHALARARDTAVSSFSHFVEDLEEVTAPSERRLVIRMKASNRLLLNVLAMKFAAPLPRAHAAQVGADLRRRPRASGPYRLAAWSEGERIRLERNPHYRDRARQGLTALEMREGVPRDLQFLMFERGELDTAERLSAPDLIFLEDHPAWQPYVQRLPMAAVYGVQMNVRTQPFDDVRVRRALNYALNKDATTKLLSGTSTPAHGPIPPGMPGRDEELPPYPYDPARARALLAEAGYSDGLDLTFTTFFDEDATKLALAMQQDLAAVGARVKIRQVSVGVWMSTMNDLSFAIGGWFGDYLDPSALIDPIFKTGGPQNSTGYSNPALDRLLDEARLERDATRRAALYRRVDRILRDDAPWIWNYHQLTVEVSQPYVRGYRLHPAWIRDFTTASLEAR